MIFNSFFTPICSHRGNIPVPNTSRHLNGPEKIIIREPTDQEPLNARMNTPVPNTARHIPPSPVTNTARHKIHDTPETIPIRRLLVQEFSSTPGNIPESDQQVLNIPESISRVSSSDTSSSYAIPQTAGEFVISPSADIHISSPAQESPYQGRDIPIVIRDSPPRKSSGIYRNIPVPNTFRHV